ncbi:hypothetical protein ACFV3R_16120 [Streptomyces sp. NPDC059740]|uniref:hypothetical protein n=1 Tax=Streptomyces sp. NPDC059740 TaxID=3346926 RepID=UPI00365D8F49
MRTTPTDGSPSDEEQAVEQPADGRAKRPGASLVFDDPLDRPSRDDTDQGWGERPASATGASDLARFLDEKPPHHI